MTDLNSLFLSKSATLKEAIRIIERGSVQIALVVDPENRLLGTVTDGDIRRCLLRGENLESNVEKAMNPNFHALPRNASEIKAELFMRDHLLHQIPGLDSDGRVCRLFVQKDMLPSKVLRNPVVLMAGGQGKRLLPATKNCPKPMLKIRGKPILEIILEQCIKAGFRNFYISVNYLKEKIIDYFGNGERWGVKICYLEEKKPMGTAGSLSLLPKEPKDPILVINGDILTRVDFISLLDFHEEQEASATICMREKETELPYGVVTSKNYRVESIEEKPTLYHNVNAGIYVLEPRMLSYLSNNKLIDMPALLEKGKAKDEAIFVFPIHEYWLDIGKITALEQAKGEWKE